MALYRIKAQAIIVTKCVLSLMTRMFNIYFLDAKTSMGGQCPNRVGDWLLNRQQVTSLTY